MGQPVVRSAGRDAGSCVVRLAGVVKFHRNQLTGAIPDFSACKQLTEVAMASLALPVSSAPPSFATCGTCEVRICISKRTFQDFGLMVLQGPPRTSLLLGMDKGSPGTAPQCPEAKTLNPLQLRYLFNFLRWRMKNQMNQRNCLFLARQLYIYGFSFGVGLGNFANR